MLLRSARTNKKQQHNNNNITKSLSPAERLHAAVRVLRQRLVSLAVVSEVQVVFEDAGPECRLRGGTHTDPHISVMMNSQMLSGTFGPRLRASR